mgnify:CR=1 FL=1
MANKKANSFVLTIAGITAATVIGVVGVKLTPAPHVIFSLAPSAEPQATAEPEPIGLQTPAQRNMFPCWIPTARA